MNKIEKLIEKYQKNYKEMRLEIPTGEIIKDLQSLQEPTEDREEFNHLGCDHASGLCFE